VRRCLRRLSGGGRHKAAVEPQLVSHLVLVGADQEGVIEPGGMGQLGSLFVEARMRARDDGQS
jgi:hypothetical protein